MAPAGQFRLEARGRATSLGQMVRNEESVGSVTVTLSTAAVAPEAGTPPWPATGRIRDSPGPKGAAAEPVPSADPKTPAPPASVLTTRAGVTLRMVLLRVSDT